MAKRILGYSKKYGNKYIIVSDEDYIRCRQHRWTIEGVRNTYYACSRIDGVKVKMHRWIFNPKKNKQIDHINHNGLDNRRENLREATHIQNTRNKGKNKRGRYKGVFWDGRMKKWVAQIQYNKRRYYLGAFKLARDAAKAYNEAAIKYFKDFAVLNKIA